MEIKFRGISHGINNSLNEDGYQENKPTNYEIIGNIHENKELIQDNEN